MPRILLNNRELSQEGEIPLTIGEFIDQLHGKTVSSDELITLVSINGSTITDETRESVYDIPINDAQLIEVETESVEEVACEAIETAIDHAEALVPVVQLAAQGYKKGDQLIGDQNFLLSMDALDLFVKLASQIIGTLRISLSSQITEEFTLQELENHLASVMEGILQCKEKGDSVAMAELLEFDLVENLVLWKDSALPRMKSYQST